MAEEAIVLARVFGSTNYRKSFVVDTELRQLYAIIHQVAQSGIQLNTGFLVR